MKARRHQLSVTFEQILSLVYQCSTEEKSILLRELVKDSPQAREATHLKDWIMEEEDEVWKNL